MTRQAAVLDAGGPSCRRPGTSRRTPARRAGRRKETSEDYRYFPEPDLVPIAPSPEWVDELRATLPELPWARRAPAAGGVVLTDEELRDLVNAGALDLIEATVAAGAPQAKPGVVAVYLAQQANAREVPLAELPSRRARSPG